MEHEDLREKPFAEKKPQAKRVQCCGSTKYAILPLGQKSKEVP